MPNKPTSSPGGQHGFTLLEVLIAVMILGLSITALLQQFQVALRAGSASGDVGRAVLHAKEKMETLKASDRLTDASESGSFDDGFEWTTESVPYQFAAETGDDTYESLKYETFQLTASVSWKQGEREKQVQLTTLKTVRKETWD